MRMRMTRNRTSNMDIDMQMKKQMTKVRVKLHTQKNNVGRSVKQKVNFEKIKKPNAKMHERTKVRVTSSKYMHVCFHRLMLMWLTP